MIVRRKSRSIGAQVLIIGFLATAEITAAQGTDVPRSITPAAKVGEEILSLEELSHALHGQLAQIEQQRYSLLSQKLEQLIEERLLLKEAYNRGVTVEQLLREEVSAKTPKVQETEVSDFIEKNRARLPQGDEFELRLKVWDYLRSQRLDLQRQAYVQGLREKAKVIVYLEEPASARVQVNPHRGFARGPKDAPVAIVEYSDFQCPFCKAVLSTVNEIMARYPEKVKWVFRDYPIATLHPTVPKAHEAARCAGEQGKFWDYHDLLFERSPSHSLEQLKQYAQELKLNGPAFAQCLESGKYQAAVAQDVQEGTHLGVTATPTFFINGRVLSGAQPIAAFQKLIESELKSTRSE
jgi:protein-disulfide isomerase